MTTSSSAGSFVRLALPRDVGQVAGIQARAWAIDYAQVLPAAVLTDVEAGASQQWQAAVDAPPTSAHHLLVAVVGPTVVGFCAVTPADDDDGGPVAVGALAILAVDPAHRGAGHGSRLLTAAMDTLRTDRFPRAVTWVLGNDTVLATFLTTAGWSADGTVRTLAAEDRELAEARWHTDLTPAPTPT